MRAVSCIMETVAKSSALIDMNRGDQPSCPRVTLLILFVIATEASDALRSRELACSRVRGGGLAPLQGFCGAVCGSVGFSWVVLGYYLGCRVFCSSLRGRGQLVVDACIPGGGFDYGVGLQTCYL